MGSHAASKIRRISQKKRLRPLIAFHSSHKAATSEMAEKYLLFGGDPCVLQYCELVSGFLFPFRHLLAPSPEIETDKHGFFKQHATIKIKCQQFYLVQETCVICTYARGACSGCHGTAPGYQATPQIHHHRNWATKTSLQQKRTGRPIVPLVPPHHPPSKPPPRIT